MQLKVIETNKGAESHIAGLYTRGPRMIFLTVIELKLKTAAAKTDQISIYVTLEIECDAFYFFFLLI